MSIRIDKDKLLSAIATDLQNVFQSEIANDYRLLTIDLSTARTDSLEIDNVISFCIVDVSSGATYSIKLFSTTNDPIDQSIAGKGFCVEGLAKASIYLTNSAQPGYYLKLLVLRRV